MNRSLEVVVQKASQETGLNWAQSKENIHEYCGRGFQTEKKAQRKAKRRDFTAATNKLVWLELRIHKGKKKRVKTEVDPGQVTKKLHHHTKKLKPYFACNECSGSFYVVSEGMRVLKCSRYY